MVQHPIQAEKLVRPVVVEVRFDNLLAIQRIVLVELDDPLDQRGLVSKIEVIEKTLGIERAAAGIHLLVAAETVKEIVPLAGGSRVTRVAGNEGAEVSLGGQDLVDTIAVSEQDVRLVIEGVERPA